MRLSDRLLLVLIGAIVVREVLVRLRLAGQAEREVQELKALVIRACDARVTG